MKTEEQIITRVQKLIELLEYKEKNKSWEDYQYYQEELHTLQWVLEDE